VEDDREGGGECDEGNERENVGKENGENVKAPVNGTVTPSPCRGGFDDRKGG
jgi:hypothetical protein